MPDFDDVVSTDAVSTIGGTGEGFGEGSDMVGGAGRRSG